MKRLYLLRHAKAVPADPSIDDFERPLHDRGRRDAPVIGRRLRERGLVPERVVSSTAARAYATARIVARELRIPVRGIVRDDGLYLAAPATLLATARATADDVGSIMLVGHNPGLTDLANALTDRRIDNLPTAAVWCADFDVARWADVERETGTLVWFDSPKQAVGD
jgi:phosphohistidine phosphatase